MCPFGGKSGNIHTETDTDTQTDTKCKDVLSVTKTRVKNERGCNNAFTFLSIYLSLSHLDDDQHILEVNGSISEAIVSGAKMVFLHGVFNNKYEFIDMTFFKDNVVVYGNEACISNSTLILKSITTGINVLTFSKLTIENSVIILFNAIVRFSDCKLNRVIIEGAASLNHNNLSHVQIYFHGSTLWCHDRLNYGIAINGNSVIKITMYDSVLHYCKVVITGSALCLNIIKSYIYDTFLQIRIQSHLRIPSVVNLQDADFLVGDLLDNFNHMLFDLHNPYFIINNCTFERLSLEIISRQYYFRNNQILFFITAIQSQFVKGHKFGDGGALLLSSNVINSSIVLSNVTFIKNRAVQLSSSEPGKGGAVFVEGHSLHLTVEGCVYENNIASDSGSALFISDGVTSMIINSTFRFHLTTEVPSTILSINGQVIVFDVLVYVVKTSNAGNGLNRIGFNIITIQQVFNEISTRIYCPLWYTNDLDYQLESLDKDSRKLNQSLTLINNLRYQCGVCPEGFYTIFVEQNTISYRSGHQKIHESPGEKSRCIPCPYGGECSGNNVVPRPNYWGFWHQDQMVFLQCPAAYCCSGINNAPCSKYNFCAGNRTGMLCGACQEGFSVSILTGQCIRNSQCGGDQWFWLLVSLASFGYAIWYTFKDAIFGYIFDKIKKLTQIYASLKIKAGDVQAKINTVSVQDIRSENVSPVGEAEVPDVYELDSINDSDLDCIREETSRMSFHGHKNRELDIEHTLHVPDSQYLEKDVDKGYFGIFSYYIQMAAIMKIHIEFSDVDKSDSFLDQIITIIGQFINIELTQLSFDVCPIVGLTTMGKLIFKLMFLFGIYFSWICLFILILVLLRLIKRKKNMSTHFEKLRSFHLQLVTGLVEIIKYTYSSFCGIIFMSLAWTRVGTEYVWWYDGSQAFPNGWQILLVIFGLFYAIPFPLTLSVGMKLLKEGQISPATFFLYCLCPASIVFFKLLKKPDINEATSDSRPLSKASKAIISVLQGKYREDDTFLTLYWEAMVSIRRILITASTIIHFASIRLIITTILNSLFLYQHVHIYPFQIKSSNYVEGLSLLLLLINSVINLLKACLTDSAVVPSGPSVSFFKGLELTEKLFVLSLLSCIFIIELKPNRKKSK